jgi:hypothetical protein
MSTVTPKELFCSVTQCINSGNLDSLIMLYESDACFASQSGHIEINIVKNPQDQNPIFISDPLKEIILHYSKQQKNDNDSSETNDINQKLVKKARRDSRGFLNMIYEINQSR